MSDLAELKTKLAMSSRMLFNAGLVDYSGHISVRISGSDHLLILPHPVSRATVKPDDMVITDFEGKLIEGKYKAPSEVNMHARAYKARSDIKAVAHLHNHMVATLSMVDKPFFPLRRKERRNGQKAEGRIGRSLPLEGEGVAETPEGVGELGVKHQDVHSRSSEKKIHHG